MLAPSITSPYAPDVEKVRELLEKMIAAMRFVEIVAVSVATKIEGRGGPTKPPKGPPPGPVDQVSRTHDAVRRAQVLTDLAVDRDILS